MDHTRIVRGPDRPERTAARAARAWPCRRVSGAEELARFALLSPEAQDGVPLSPRAWARLAAALKAAALLGDFMT